jgi:hypothetical protein
MSFRYDKDRQFEADLPDTSTPEWDRSSSPAEAGTMRELHLASESVLRLATQSYDADARGDTLAGRAARASLKSQLELTTRMIDELLFNSIAPHTTH